jgi:hypothetical protein
MKQLDGLHERGWLLFNGRVWFLLWEEKMQKTDRFSAMIFGIPRIKGLSPTCFLWTHGIESISHTNILAE